jgi:hypothetical protein
VDKVVKSKPQVDTVKMGIITCGQSVINFFFFLFSFLINNSISSTLMKLIKDTLLFHLIVNHFRPYTTCPWLNFLNLHLRLIELLVIIN